MSLYPDPTSQDPHVIVFDASIFVKFQKTISIVSLAGATVQLYTPDATPQPILNAFLPLNLAEDYNTISRTLELHFNATILPNTLYTVVINGLTDVAGNVLSQFSYNFTTNPSTILTGPISAEPISVEDHSLKTEAFTSFEVVTEINPNFYVYDTDPDAQTVILDNNYNNGRITIKFSHNPSGEFLNTQYFKIQTKTIARGAANRWQTVDGIIISLDSNKGFVYIDFPSLDSVPVYNQIGHTYFIDGNKYRIKVSKDVGV